MAHRISIESKGDNARAATLFKTFKARVLKAKLRGVSVSSAYVVDAKLTPSELKAAKAALTNAVIERSSTTRILSPAKFSHAIELGFLPGVTDNVGNTARQILADATGRSFKEGESVYSSRFIFLEGVVSAKDAALMAAELYNPLIERASITPFKEWKNGAISVTLPKVKLGSPKIARAVDLDLPDEELALIGKKGIGERDGKRRGPLALSLTELVAIRAYFKKKKRLPTDVELESVAQTWSEHCKHTIFADPLDEIEEGIYKRYIKGATELIRKKKGSKDFCVSVFKDNSGAIAFNDDYLVTHKVETHNSPSALDPYGGAITGIVGVNRDTLGFGMGAKPIANVYGFCVGEPDDTRKLYRDEAKTEAMLSPRRILDGVVKGIEAGGNQSGIPTPLGFVYADESYRGKPLVFAGTVGLIPRRSKGRDLAKKKARAGDYIVMIGGRVGLDGIHGATFSSEALAAGSPATAVQIGDAITQKKMSDAIIRELRDAGLYSSITDNGAGGISCSVAEMAQECGGCEVELSSVPLKYPGLAPWQIWISESQERMTLSVPPAKWKKLKAILDKHGTEATRIGRFTRSGSCVVRYKKKEVMNVELSFLHDGRPKKRLASKKPEIQIKPLPVSALHADLRKSVLSVLGGPNVGSSSFISELYDHEVQGLSITKPLIGRGRVNADAGVIRPLRNDKHAVVLSQGYAPSYSVLDPYKMAAASIDTAIRNAICAGASLSHLAILDNFCWSSSNEPERLWQLKEAARACYDYAVAYGTPFISGKDSMFNDFRGYEASGKKIHIAALPTLIISAIGVTKDAGKAMTFDLKEAGNELYLVGETTAEFGGSEFVKAATGSFAYGTVPAVDAKKNLAAYKAIEGALGKRLVASALGLSRGGLAATAAKMALAGQLGMELTLTGPADVMLFSESQGRMLVEVAPRNKKAFLAAMKGIPTKKIGAVTKSPSVSFTIGSKHLLFSLGDLSKAYHAAFKDF